MSAITKKLINFDIYFVIFWHWSFEERIYVQSSAQICSILMALIYYLLFVMLGPIELKYGRNFKMTIYNWCANVPLSNVAEFFLGNRKKGKGKEKKWVEKTNKDYYFQENA